MFTSSNTTISYAGKQAAILGWQFDSTRELWCRTSIFWEVSEPGRHQSPPRHLMRNFVPGRKCPRGNCERITLNEPRVFANGILYRDHSNGIFSSSNGSSSSTTPFHSISHYNNSSSSAGRQGPASTLPFHSISQYNNSSSSAGRQGSASTGSILFPYSAHPEAIDLKGKRGEPLKRSHLSLPRMKLTTPEGKESDFIVPGDEPLQRGSRSATTTRMARSRPRSETGDVGDIFDFDEWKEETVNSQTCGRSGEMAQPDRSLRYRDRVCSAILFFSCSSIPSGDH